ncbi:MAG TPA: YbjN domain-containing protein [Beutenbergiaceae bacterium]|nr:YbjN domain-containing protein [Beutenbergiaceae bacterium]
MSDPTDLPGVSAWPAPVTYERLQQVIAAAGITVTPTESERLTARVEDNLVEISVASGKNTILRVLGLAGTTVPMEQQSALATFANNWHRERTWPTLMWTPAKDGALALRSVYTVDVTAGATDEQLSTAIKLGISVTARGLGSARDALTKGDGSEVG